MAASYDDLFKILDLPFPTAQLQTLTGGDGLFERWHKCGVLGPLNFLLHPRRRGVPESEEYLNSLLMEMFRHIGDLMDTCPGFKGHWNECRDTIVEVGCEIDWDKWGDLQAQDGTSTTEN